MEYSNIGKIVSVFGLKGEMILVHTLGKSSTLKGLPAIFIEEKKDSFIPWFIESARSKSAEEIYLKIEGLDTREQALKLVQKKVWIPTTELEKFAAKTSPVGLVGYELIDDSGTLGNILELVEQPHQMICRIEINEQEVLIPLNEETLKKIDRKNKKVFVELPEGLLDVYLK